MKKSLLGQFLHEMKNIRGSLSNVPETSFYPALSNLFNNIGCSLQDSVLCVINISNKGSGLPDGGFFLKIS